MAFSTADLDSINAAIASGELTVSVQGRSVTYRSLDDLLKPKLVFAELKSDFERLRTDGTLDLLLQLQTGQASAESVAANRTKEAP